MNRIKKGDTYTAHSGHKLLRLNAILNAEGYKTKIEYSGALPRLVITKVTWKARLRKLRGKRWKK